MPKDKIKRKWETISEEKAIALGVKALGDRVKAFELELEMWNCHYKIVSYNRAKIRKALGEAGRHLARQERRMRSGKKNTS